MTHESTYFPPSNPLVRADNGIFGGICAGLAQRFDVPAWAVRVLWLMAIFAWGTGLALYLIAWYCVPKASNQANARQPRFLGVCARVGQALEIDVAVVRILAVFAALASLGTFFIVYLVLHIIVPKRGSDRNLLNA